MNDDQIEALLRKYRPMTRLPALPITRLPALPITRLPDLPITRSPRTWPWAAAAAALLAVSVGLHAGAWPSTSPPQIDAAQVTAIAEQLGDDAQGRVVAEWIVREQRSTVRVDTETSRPFVPIEPQ